MQRGLRWLAVGVAAGGLVLTAGVGANDVKAQDDTQLCGYDGCSTIIYPRSQVPEMPCQTDICRRDLQPTLGDSVFTPERQVPRYVPHYEELP
jgi:hypothetical protein